MISCLTIVHLAGMTALAEYLLMRATLRINLADGITERLSLLRCVASLRRDARLEMDARDCCCSNGPAIVLIDAIDIERAPMTKDIIRVLNINCN